MAIGIWCLKNALGPRELESALRAHLDFEAIRKNGDLVIGLSAKFMHVPDQL